jgi:hypothetical protein
MRGTKVEKKEGKKLPLQYTVIGSLSSLALRTMVIKAAALKGACGSRAAADSTGSRKTLLHLGG